MTEIENKKTNIWKTAFLVLLGILVGCAVFLFIQFGGDREEEYHSSQSTEEITDASFSVQLEKEQVNNLISYYLNDFLKDSGVKYKFYLEDQALLNGTFDLLGYDMQFYLYFDPFVMENGDIKLKAKELSIGKLPLPVSQVMKFAKKKFDVPNWVEIDIENETVVLHLSDFQMKNNMKIKAEKINLIDDDIRFDVYIPTATEEDE